MSDFVDKSRARVLVDRPSHPEGNYILYWMHSARRLRYNAGLALAVHRANLHQRPLVVLEALRRDYPHACDRFHTFLVQGMEENARLLCESGCTAYPYIEPKPGSGKGLLRALAEDAVEVITDDHPGFFIPRMLQAATRALSHRRFVAVDSVGVMPLSMTPRAFPRAASYRRFLHDSFDQAMALSPCAAPLQRLDQRGAAKLPDGLSARWGCASLALLERQERAWSALQLGHPGPVKWANGGHSHARTQLEAFLGDGLSRYAKERNHPDAEVSSGLSPWLHFGHLSASEVLHEVLAQENWSRAQINHAKRGKREGWWGLSKDASAFLDELLVWRELAQVSAHHSSADHASYSALPDWARKTLSAHEGDPRKWLSFDDLEQARTPSPLWNAAQRQLLEEGRIQGYLRMLWGKMVLEWSQSPQEAYERLLLLNDRYALDGRDPSSVLNIQWIFGAYDRAWGPERPVYGKVRYMNERSTLRKLRLKGYLKRWGA